MILKDILNPRYFTKPRVFIMLGEKLQIAENTSIPSKTVRKITN